MAVSALLRPYSVLSQKSSLRALKLSWRTAQSSKQVICCLLPSLLSAQLCCGKAASPCAHRDLDLLWLTAKSCWVFCPLGTSLTLLLNCSVAPSWSFVLGEAKNALPNELWGVTSPSATQGSSSGQLIVRFLPAVSSPTFSLYLTLLCKKCSLPFADLWVSLPQFPTLNLLFATCLPPTVEISFVILNPSSLIPSGSRNLDVDLPMFEG